MNKKVLFITYYWPPSGGAGVQRVLKFIKYLPHFDIEPLVLTVENPTYSIIDETLEEDIPKGLKVFKSRSFEPFGLYASLSGKPVSEVAKPTTRLTKTAGYFSRMASWIRANIFIPDARIGWLPTARSKALEIARDHAVDAVITSGPPHSVHFAGKYLKNKLDLRWIADFRDPWTRVYYNQLLPRSKPAKKLDLILERSVLEKADEVPVISPSMERMQKEILDRSYTLITNGFDHEDFLQTDSTAAEPERPFTIRHVGSIGESSVPSGLFRALSRVPESLDWKLEFIGNVHGEVHDLVDVHDLEDRVQLRPYIPHAEAIEAMKSADLLLLVIPNTDQNELILTGKLFEYIGSGRPVMLVGPGEGDACKILKELDNPWCFEHDETERQLEFLKKIMRKPEGFRSRVEIEDLKHHPYSRYVLTEKLAELVMK